MCRQVRRAGRAANSRSTAARSDSGSVSARTFNRVSCRRDGEASMARFGAFLYRVRKLRIVGVHG